MNALHLIVAFILGAISFGVFALVMLIHMGRRPSGITMNARRAVDVPPRRQWRDAPERREEGVRYEWINLTGEER
jgi:hypothetical protein